MWPSLHDLYDKAEARESLPLTGRATADVSRVRTLSQPAQSCTEPTFLLYHEPDALNTTSVHRVFQTVIGARMILHLRAAMKVVVRHHDSALVPDFTTHFSSIYFPNTRVVTQSEY